jgi:hypothetical protein
MSTTYRSNRPLTLHEVYRLTGWNVSQWHEGETVHPTWGVRLTDGNGKFIWCYPAPEQFEFVVYGDNQGSEGALVEILYLEEI